MQIDGARANGAAAGERHASDAEAGHERAERENRGAHRFDEFVGRFRMVQRGRGDGVIAGRNFRDGDARAHEREELAHGDEVADLGDVVHRYLVRGEQRGSHHRQRGIFRAADGYGSVQGIAAFD